LIRVCNLLGDKKEARRTYEKYPPRVEKIKTKRVLLRVRELGGYNYECLQ